MIRGGRRAGLRADPRFEDKVWGRRAKRLVAPGDAVGRGHHRGRSGRWAIGSFRIGPGGMITQCRHKDFVKMGALERKSLDKSNRHRVKDRSLVRFAYFHEGRAEWWRAQGWARIQAREWGESDRLAGASRSLCLERRFDRSGFQSALGAGTSQDGKAFSWSLHGDGAGLVPPRSE